LVHAPTLHCETPSVSTDAYVFAVDRQTVGSSQRHTIDNSYIRNCFEAMRQCVVFSQI